ncbi:MAG TPA: T9SS type A sorting domain-containing protein [Ignavibacteria bacterium]|nr:T9SS type A sorting domain-containing protein [Ignavibacteria bacterium]HMR41460.1 T9SS type A sorting domain-containing protein [Ignavibacteria bacterium]
MKNSIKTLVLIILSIVCFHENAISWTGHLNISNQQCLPTSYKTYSDVYIMQFEVHINRIPIFDPTLYKVDIYFIQDEVTLPLAGTYPINTDVANPQVIAMSINSLRPLCWNKDAIIKAHIYENGTPSSSEDVYGYFRIYKESGGGPGNCTNDIKAVNNFDAVNVHASNVQIQWSNQGCGFSTGYTYCDRYKLSKTIYFQNDQVLNINPSKSMGFSAIASGNNQQLWSGIENQTSTSATLVTFVYKLNDGTNRWHPCKPEQAAIAYTLTERPVIGSLVQNPYPIPNYGSGTIKCNIIQGNDVRYTWTVIYPNQYVSLVTHGEYTNYATVYSSAPGNIDVPNFKIKCKAWNSLGYSESIITPYFGTIAGGCPFIFPYDSSYGFRNDNNILHRSEFEENYGNDIKDVYKLTCTPRAEDNVLKIAIKETESDLNFFNNIKLYAIDHSPIYNVVVTESNDIAIYDPVTVVSPEEAYQNSSIITPLIQYDTSSSPSEHKVVTGDTGDSVIADYNQESLRKVVNTLRTRNRGTSVDSLAIFAEIGPEEKDGPLPIIPIKRPAGLLTIESDLQNNVDKIFARRENICPIVIPFSDNSDAIESISIKWFLDYTIKFLSVVDIFYEGFTKTEIPLFGAWHSQNGDVLTSLQELDSNYAELDSSSYITLVFSDINPPSFGKVRDYVIEVDGHYLVENYVGNYMQERPQETTEIFKKDEQSGLIGNFPNPFNPSTIISYNVGDFSKVSIIVYDNLGKEVTKLVNEFKTPGKYSVSFNSKNLASGVYYYKLQVGNSEQVKKMLLLK